MNMRNASLDLQDGVSPTARVAPPEGDLFLHLIPSETSVAERRFLFKLFANDWNGRGAVVEIGPFLGGTTRAIATGMAANPQLAADARLHTFDRFDDYYSGPQLRAMIDPMVQGGVFSAAEADDLCRDANFERLFHAIHRPQRYGSLVQLHNSPLPDLPEEVEQAKSLACLEAEREIGALFVDGCKSWASTLYALKTLLPRLPVGAPVVFQDYGWYTCFWISSAVHALRDFLQPVAWADSTYSFRLARTITTEEVTARFATTPGAMGETFFIEAAEALYKRSHALGDLRGELIAQLHLIAAFATLGRKGQAAKLLQQIEVRRYAAHVNMIRGCLRSPTYLPGGKEIVWKQAA